MRKQEGKLFNVAIFGDGKYIINRDKNNLHNKIYNIWYTLLRRCYDEKQQVKQPTYIGCSVVNEWLNFQIFAEWYEKNYVDDWHLDKDILINGNKIYGPNTCCFVPRQINQLFVKSSEKIGSLPVGISLNKQNKYLVCMKINGKSTGFGTYKTIDEALKVYKSEKKKYIIDVTNKFKDKLNSLVYQTLINYEV